MFRYEFRRFSSIFVAYIILVQVNERILATHETVRISLPEICGGSRVFEYFVSSIQYILVYAIDSHPSNFI